MAKIEPFEGSGWHDNAVHGFRILEGEDGCSGELVLDIDYIVQWVSPENENNSYSFQIAPADLTFHDVTELVISIDYASSTAALQPMTIHEIHREVVTYPNGWSSFSWRIEINWPRNSFISFISSGFTQFLRIAAHSLRCSVFASLREIAMTPNSCAAGADNCSQSLFLGSSTLLQRLA